MSSENSKDPNDAQALVQAIDLGGKKELIRTNPADDNLRLFSSLTLDDKPLVPIPAEVHLNVSYPRFQELRCAICQSPYRELVEHVYLHAGRKPQEVIRFFQRHFAAKLNYVQIATHMENHCNLKNVVTWGLDTYSGREEEVSEWIGREDQLALIALLVEMGDVRGIDCSKNNELKIKRAAMIERLASRIMDIKKNRDENLHMGFNVFEIMAELHDKMESEADKRIIRDKMKEMRIKLQSLSES